MRKLVVLALLLCALLTSGCGKPPLVLAKGLVTIDGKPTGNVRIILNPVNPPEVLAPSQIGVGMTDKDGRFSIISGEGEGVAKGEYHVTFSLMKTPGGRVAGPDERPDGAVETIPQPYSDHQHPEKSPITVVIDGSQELKFEVPGKTKK